MIATVLLAAAQADKTVEESQVLDESKSVQKQHKREHTVLSPPPPPPPPTQVTLPNQHQQQPHQVHGPRYVMKDMIVYLTPSQIKALQTGQGTLKLLPQSQPQSRPQPQLPHFMQKLMQQNTLHQEGQLIQREIEAQEANRKNRLQLQEVVAGAPTENLNHHQHQQEQQQQQQEQQQHQRILQQQQEQQQQHQQILQQQQEQQQLLLLQQHQQEQLQHLPNIESQHQAQFQLINQEQHLALVPQLQLISQQPHEEALLTHEKQYHKPLFFVLPQIKPVGNKNLQLFLNPTNQNDEQQQLLLLHKNNPVQHLNHHNFNFIPYEYGAENELEAKKIFIAHLENQLDAYRLNAHQLDAQQLEASDQRQQYHQITSEPLDTHQVDLEAQHKAHQFESQLEAHQLHAAHLENQHLDAHHLQEVQKTHLLDETEKLPTALPLTASFKSQLKGTPQLDTHNFKIDELPTLQEFQMKEILDAQKLKKQIQAQEKEAKKLDDQLKAEELKVEDLKEEQEHLKLSRELNAKKNEFHSILNPLMQHHNILDILKEPTNFSPPELEKGFVPIEYTPKDNQEKYAREIEKILLENQIDKQKALTQAAAIANQPPVVVKQEIVKHVKLPIPAPYIVRIPEPFEVKVPQPYPVPLEIIRHVPYPVVKVEQVEVEKHVPVEVEKRVPYTVEKKVFVKVNKPYVVKRIVPVGVKKTVPIEIPIRNKNQKLSIIKHIWEH